MIDFKKIEKENNKVKFRYRLKLGLSQLVNEPLLNLIWLPIVAILFALWKVKETVMTGISLPQIIYIPLTYSIIVLEVLLPVIFTMSTLTAIAEITAKRDENALVVAFQSSDLIKGHPILVEKKKIDTKGTTRRVFYSNIPLKTWEIRKESIADAMNISFLKSLDYDNGNGKKIEMLTTSGKNLPDRGVMYDEP